jgi:hypothetical protein
MPGRVRGGIKAQGFPRYLGASADSDFDNYDSRSLIGYGGLLNLITPILISIYLERFSIDVLLTSIEYERRLIT